MRGWKVELYLGASLFTLLFLRTLLYAGRLFQQELMGDWVDAPLDGKSKRAATKRKRGKPPRDAIFEQLMTPDGPLYNTSDDMRGLIDHINEYTRCTHRAIPPLRGRESRNSPRTPAEDAKWNPDTACLFDPGEHEALFSNLHMCKIGDVTVRIPKAPSFIIIGAQKGGTTSIFDYLMEHPAIRPTMNWFLSGQLRHEVHFFDFELRPLKKFNTFKSESDFYCLAAKKYAETNFDMNAILKADLYQRPLLSFEKTPRYILRPNIPAVMKRTCPWVTKLIAVLRDPVARAFSEFNMDSQRTVAAGDTPHAFDKAVREELMHLQENGLVRRSYDFTGDKIPEKIVPLQLTVDQEEEIFARVETQKPRYIKRGMYAIQLQSWEKEYSIPDNLLVLNSGGFHDGGERETFQRIIRHVGLPDYEKEYFEPVHQRYYNFQMLNSTRELLEKFFEPYNERLPSLLGNEWQDVWKY